MQICVFLERIGGLEFQRRATRNKLVVRKAFLGNKRSFVMEKNAQFATENDNNFKKYQFFTFSCHFCHISKDCSDQNVKYFQPRMISVSNRVVCGDKCRCVKKELPHVPRNGQKILTFFFNFGFYNAIFVKVSTFSGIGNLKRFNNN